MIRLAANTSKRIRILSHQKTNLSSSARGLSTAVSTTGESSSSSSSIPSVLDNVVTLNFVDPSGARRQVPGYIGKTIYETCQMNDIDLGPASVGGLVEKVQSSTWTEPLYGEGPTTGYDHVLLVGNGAETASAKTWMEEKALGDYWDDDEIFPESRLASQVTVTKEMDGITVYVPDRIVDDIP